MAVRRAFGLIPPALVPAGRFFGSGELRLALLALIAERAGHGYDLMHRLEARFDGAYEASAGAIYPTLQQLEDEGLVRLEVAGGRKVYHITEGGRGEVAATTEVVDEIWARAARRGEWGPVRHPDAAEIVAPAMRLMKAAVKAVVHARGNPEVIDRIRSIVDDARRQIEHLDRRRRR
jgi:DNA-binding PadR family transcriptional regulator